MFSYSVRPSGNCVAFHRGFRPPATDSGTAVAQSIAGGGDAPGAVNRAELAPLGGATPLAPLGGATPLSTYSVIIIIATDPTAQLTTGEPVQKLDDMLPLTSSAILMRLPVGVMF